MGHRIRALPYRDGWERLFQIGVAAAVLALLNVCGCAISKSPNRAACRNALGQISPCSIGLSTPRCEGQQRDIAERILEQQCAAFDTTSEWGQRLCRMVGWLGLCHPARTLAEAVAISSLDEACPRARLDPLCDLLRTADASHSAAAYDAARAAIVQRVNTEPRAQVVRDKAVHWFVRERTMALFAWNVVTRLGADRVEPPGYAAQVQRLLDRHYPAYGHSAFAMARTWLPPRPASASCEQREGLVLFPGVVRVVNRNEFEPQRQALQAAFPCLETVLVDAGTFIEPSVNAAQGRKAIAALDERIGKVPLHLIGYSQGSLNALWLLATDPQIASRMQTMLTFNSAAHGSEVADQLLPFVEAAAAPATACRETDPAIGPLCEVGNQLTASTSDFVLGATACAMGLPEGDLQRFIAAEHDVQPATTLREFLSQHLAGVRSLTTSQASQFWRDQAAALPSQTLFLSFRSIVRDPKRDLPASNCLAYQLLNRSNPEDPYNDMQVRLFNQSLGGPVADREVVGAVAEGNHWQWKLVAADLPELIMPRAMTDDLPERELFVAYYQALHDVGLLLRDTSPN